MVTLEQAASPVIATRLRESFVLPKYAQLIEEDPGIRQDFLESAYQLATNHYNTEDFEWIDRGRCSFVYGMPGRPDKCIKVVGRHTMRNGVRPPSLKTEAIFMNAVGNKLSRRPESGVKTPDLYALARFGGGAAMLMGRVPEPYVNIRKLPRDIGDGAIFELGERSAARFLDAMGGSALRLGMGDVRGVGHYVNLGNFMLDADNPLESEELYVIDLVGRSLSRQAMAFITSRALV